MRKIDLDVEQRDASAAVSGDFYRKTVFSVFQFRKAFFANDLSFKNLSFIQASAKNTRGLIFFQDDGIFVHKNFNGILCAERKIFSDFNGKNDSSEFINASDNSCRFHNGNSSGKFDYFVEYSISQKHLYVNHLHI